MIEIKQIFNKEKYMELLLEADPEKEIVEEYLKNSEMFGLFENNKLISEILLIEINNDICELKNIATVEEARGKGYGKKLITYVSDLYKNKYKKMIVGTTENNIPFYVKCRI